MDSISTTVDFHDDYGNVLTAIVSGKIEQGHVYDIYTTLDGFNITDSCELDEYAMLLEEEYAAGGV